MKRLLSAAGIIACVGLSLDVGGMARAQTPAPDSGGAAREASAPRHATGTFDVKLTALGTADSADTAGSKSLGRMAVAKQIHGDLEGTSTGEMLTAFTSVKGSAVYVAIERVSGTLHGRRGTFVLHHTGIMTRGAQQLTITVVPDSGTDELTGLAGKMTIKIENGEHFYDFEYTLGAAP
jgi:hypothetical protein